MIIYILYGHGLKPKPRRVGVWAQWGQYNKFVESGWKN